MLRPAPPHDCKANSPDHAEELAFYSSFKPLIGNALYVDLRPPLEQKIQEPDKRPSKTVALDVDDTLIDEKESIRTKTLVFRNIDKIRCLFADVKAHNKKKGYKDHLLGITTARSIKKQIAHLQSTEDFKFLTLFQILKSLGLGDLDFVIASDNEPKHRSLSAFHEILYGPIIQDTVFNNMVLVDNDLKHRPGIHEQDMRFIFANPADINDTFWDEIAAFRFPVKTFLATALKTSVQATGVLWQAASYTTSACWARFSCCRKEPAPSFEDLLADVGEKFLDAYAAPKRLD